MQNKKKKNTTEIEGTISTAEASAALKARENEKPGKYSSPYADEIDSLLGSLSSREPFKYKASGDALFREYSDRYARDAKRAMKDTAYRRLRKLICGDRGFSGIRRENVRAWRHHTSAVQARLHPLS